MFSMTTFVLFATSLRQRSSSYALHCTKHLNLKPNGVNMCRFPTENTNKCRNMNHIVQLKRKQTKATSVSLLLFAHTSLSSKSHENLVHLLAKDAESFFCLSMIHPVVSTSPMPCFSCRKITELPLNFG